MVDPFKKDNSIFNDQLSKYLGPKVAAAALPQGLPIESLGPLIAAIAANDIAALKNIPGVTPSIIQSSVKALQEAFLVSFRYVWVSAGCFTVIAIVGNYVSLVYAIYLTG